jgi:two-component system alkaline phosphatase synthesis response regulator PhoP
MSARGRILLVDDEADNLRTYAGLLKAEGYAVRTASGADAALAAALESVPDLVLSDVSMPGGDGLSLLARLRAEKKTARVPVILMSGLRKGADDQADGLDQGADDYLPKPVSARLLSARIAAVLRRYGSPAELGERLREEGLELDVGARTVEIGGKRVPLTRKEFDLLTVFLRKRGRVLSIPFLLEAVWGYDPADYSDPHTVGVHVSTLRRKIGRRLGARIVALPGLGYRFEA